MLVAGGRVATLGRGQAGRELGFRVVGVWVQEVVGFG